MQIERLPIFKVCIDATVARTEQEVEPNDEKHQR